MSVRDYYPRLAAWVRLLRLRRSPAYSWATHYFVWSALTPSRTLVHCIQSLLY